MTTVNKFLTDHYGVSSYWMCPFHGGITKGTSPCCTNARKATQREIDMWRKAWGLNATYMTTSSIDAKELAKIQNKTIPASIVSKPADDSNNTSSEPVKPIPEPVNPTPQPVPEKGKKLGKTLKKVGWRPW